MIKQLAVNPVSLYAQYLVNMVANSVRFRGFKQGYMSLAMQCEIGRGVVFFRDVRAFRSRIGRHSYVSSDTLIIDADIGSFCSIADNCYIGMPSHPTNMVSTHPMFFSSKPSAGLRVLKMSKHQEFVKTIIGHDVWIGSGAKIRGGVRIGNGAIIAAGAVVIRDVEPYSIMAGVPAVEKRKRFSTQDIALVAQSNWWQWSDKQLVDSVEAFSSPGVFERVVRAIESDGEMPLEHKG